MLKLVAEIATSIGNPAFLHSATAVTPLTGGSVNQLFRVDFPDRREVLRINGDAPGIDRHREALILQWADNARLGAQVIENSFGRGYCRFEFLSQPMPELDPIDIGKWFRTLHAMPVEDPVKANRLDPTALATRYEAHQQYVDMAGELDTDASVLCHNDLAVEHLFVRDDRLVAIDWEYAQWGCRWLDLGFHVARVGADERYCASLLEAYDPGSEVRHRQMLAAGVRLAREINRLWAIVRGRSST